MSYVEYVIKIIIGVPIILTVCVFVKEAITKYISSHGSRVAKKGVRDIITDQDINNHINNLLKSH
jgi:hypothetical protein